jgi:integrase
MPSFRTPCSPQSIKPPSGDLAASRRRRDGLTSPDGEAPIAGGNLAVAESAEQTKDGVRYKPPKSGRGRSVALSPTAIAELREHRKRQGDQLLRSARGYRTIRFVYTREDGEPMQPRSPTHAWDQAIGQPGLPRIRLHDLRHDHAMHLLASASVPKLSANASGIRVLG